MGKKGDQLIPILELEGQQLIVVRARWWMGLNIPAIPLHLGNNIHIGTTETQKGHVLRQFVQGTLVVENLNTLTEKVAQSVMISQFVTSGVGRVSDSVHDSLVEQQTLLPHGIETGEGHIHDAGLEHGQPVLLGDHH